MNWESTVPHKQWSPLPNRSGGKNEFYRELRGNLEIGMTGQEVGRLLIGGAGLVLQSKVSQLS